MRGIERRLEKLEERLEARTTTPWWNNPDIREAAQKLMESPLEQEQNPHLFSGGAIRRSRFKYEFLERFGMPVYLDNVWRWPQYRETPGQQQHFNPLP